MVECFVAIFFGLVLMTGRQVEEPVPDVSPSPLTFPHVATHEDPHGPVAVADTTHGDVLSSAVA